MITTPRVTLAALALALAVPACAIEDSSTTSSELGIPPSGGNGNHFYYAAYSKVPYIYKGCPDPGPEPWAERATLLAKRGTHELELELGTAVPLEVSARDLPRGVGFRGNARGGVITVDDANGGEPIGLSFVVSSGRCSYRVEAEIAYQ